MQLGACSLRKPWAERMEAQWAKSWPAQLWLGTGHSSYNQDCLQTRLETSLCPPPLRRRASLATRISVIAPTRFVSILAPLDAWLAWPQRKLVGSQVIRNHLLSAFLFYFSLGCLSDNTRGLQMFVGSFCGSWNFFIRRKGKDKGTWSWHLWGPTMY